MKAMAGCRLSLAMTSRPPGMTIPTLEFPTAPFAGRGRCRRWHQGWIGPIVRWIESGLMNGATGSVVHSGITTYFLYHAPLGRRCAMLKQERVQMQHWTGHSADLSHTANNRASRTLKPATQGGTRTGTTNYRISEGQTEGWACSDFKIQRKLKYLIDWSMSAPLQKYELSSMKWASNGELSTHDIHKLLSKMSQAQAIDRQTQCLEPIEIPK